MESMPGLLLWVVEYVMRFCFANRYETVLQIPTVCDRVQSINLQAGSAALLRCAVKNPAESFGSYTAFLLHRYHFEELEPYVLISCPQVHRSYRAVFFDDINIVAFNERAKKLLLLPCVP